MRYKGTFAMSMVIPAIYVTFCTSALGAIPEIEGSVDTYFTDSYFWRAVGDGDPHLQYAFALSTTIRNLGISLSPWVSHNLDNMDVDEVDYTFDLSYSIAGVSANGGFIYYDVTGADETGEIYGSAGYETDVAKLLTLSPQLTLYYDVMEVEKAYLEIALSAGTAFTELLSASISATVGYDLGQYKSDEFDGGPTVLQIGASAEYQILDKITLTPGFTYVVGLDDVFESDHFVGLSVGFGF